jgi:hypothetical protein
MLKTAVITRHARLRLANLLFQFSRTRENVSFENRRGAHGTMDWGLFGWLGKGTSRFRSISESRPWSDQKQLL